jgi:uncharacterized protein
MLSVDPPEDGADSINVSDTTDKELTLRWNEPLAVEITAAVQRGQAGRVRQLLDKHPGLARTRIVKDGEAAGARTLLHLFADWPGHRRNPHEIVAVLVAAGADPNAPGLPSDQHQGQETPLHWAASNDDVELVDALLDFGANVDAPGSVIGGLGPIADAAVFGGQRAGLRLVERGARTNLYQAAALGLVDRVQAELDKDPGPEEITRAFWAACGGDHQDVATMLLAAGADINWLGWNNQTALDAARAAQAIDLAAWLEANGGEVGAPLEVGKPN